MAEYIKRSDAIMAITRAELPDKTENGIPIANGKRRVTDCIRRIKAIPSADVQPVKHGQWVLDNPKQVLMHCSNCNWLNLSWKWKYCPKCGAKMDGEE